MQEVIVEIGNSHEGSLGIAKSLIDMALSAGATVVKFQMHIPEAEGIPSEPFRVKFSDQDLNRQEYWKRVNFTTDQWKIIANYCEQKKIEFLCTPFSVESATILFENNLVKRWKVGSGNATDWPLIDYLTSTKLPLVISTGLISSEEILTLKNRLISAGAWGYTTLLHCVSKYPVSIEHIDLHLMESLMELGCRVGYSDHSGNVQVGILALARGASIVEVHMTPHKMFFGPDVSSSLLPEEVSELIKFSNLLELMSGKGRTKEIHFEEVKELRKIFRKGIYWANNVKPGQSIKVSDLKFLKPVNDFDVVDFESLIGKKAKKETFEGSPVKADDLN
jgi:N,N'-diacetyllegionaminate synthase